MMYPVCWLLCLLRVPSWRCVLNNNTCTVISLAKVDGREADLGGVRKYKSLQYGQFSVVHD